MNVEKRRYKITSFREIEGTTDVRVILVAAEPVKANSKDKKIGAMDMMKDPAGFAQGLMKQQMNQMIHDTFLISRDEYLKQKYMIGEYITVTIEKE